MDDKIKVWTKQNKNILNDLDLYGRYLVKKEYIQYKMEEHSDIYFHTYNWLYSTAKNYMNIPKDANYPVWVSVTKESKIQNSEGNVILEILLKPEQLFVLDLEKWGRIVNYMYIPKDHEDEEKHDVLLRNYRVDDSTAYMSSFYPNIKNKIIRSWDRLFDDSIVLGPAKVGIIWEVKKEWITNIEW